MSKSVTDSTDPVKNLPPFNSSKCCHFCHLPVRCAFDLNTTANLNFMFRCLGAATPVLQVHQTSVSQSPENKVQCSEVETAAVPSGESEKAGSTRTCGISHKSHVHRTFLFLKL